MRGILTIWERELEACFLSPVAYVTMVFFLGASNFTFIYSVDINAGRIESLPGLLVNSVLIWMTILITVICMRLFAEERRSGAIELLMTAPVSEGQIVIGKYAGAMTFLVMAAAPAMLAIYILDAMSPGIRSVDAGSMIGGCVILLLVSGLCVAAGLLVSLFTRNQIIAAIGCFCVTWSILLAGHFMSLMPFGLEAVGSYISVVSHVDDFSRGLMDSRPMVIYLSGTILLLFVSVRVLESNRWR